MKIYRQILHHARSFTFSLSLFFVLAVLAVQISVPQNASAGYDGGQIISDGVFLNAASMNASAIQSFLASKGGGIANMNFVLNCYGADSKERQWYTAVGAPCDQSIPASHIIYYAAQIYGVSPQVILATIQKEQSLITAPNPTSWQINQAMGYGCPTSGQCGGNSTFAYQIDSGTWALRYHYERARGNNNWWSPSASWVCGTEKNYYKPNLYPGQNVNFYDENGTLYRTHFISNAATSAFYCYTPHAYNNPQGLYGRPAYGHTGMYYSGSYNFVYFYEAWFGSTYGPTKIIDGPGSVSWGNGRIDVFARGSDNGFWQKWYDESLGGWQPWVKLPGLLESAPTVSSWGSGRLDIFSTNSGGELQHQWFTGGAWGTWENLGKPSSSVSISGSPGAISWGNGRIDVFARGSDGVLWQKWYDESLGGWQPWVRIGGVLNSSPTISSWGPGRLDLFSTGPAGDLQHIWYDQNLGGWQPWESLGYTSGGQSLTFGPGAISWGNGRIDVFARGSDGVLWQKWYDESLGGWRPWVRFHGVLNSSPTISSWGPGRLDLFSTGPAGDLQHFWYSEPAGGWRYWETFGYPAN